MKVLEEKPWTTEATCKGCGSRLEVEAADVRAVEFEISDCDHTSYSCKCGVCKTDIELEAGKIAPGVRDEAVKRWRKSRKSRW